MIGETQKVLMHNVCRECGALYYYCSHHGPRDQARNDGELRTAIAKTFLAFEFGAEVDEDDAQRGRDITEVFGHLL